jgi:hypothetical protein
MKNNYTLQRKVLLLLLLMTSGVAKAQNSWFFPMVFRDATGISDTLWFVQNDNATIGLDEQFGEGQCEVDTSMFGVFFIIENTPSKVLAIPFSDDFEEYVFATKWEFPITISWDKTLFDETIGGFPPIQDAKLLNRYSDNYDLYGNMVFDDPGWFILGIDSTGPQPPFDENDEDAWDEFYEMGYASTFFPMEVTLSRDILGVEESKMESGLQMEIFPIPAKDKVVIEGIEAAEVQVYNALGQMVKKVRGTNEIDLSGLVEGVYLLRITDVDGRSNAARVLVKQ